MRNHAAWTFFACLLQAAPGDVLFELLASRHLSDFWHKIDCALLDDGVKDLLSRMLHVDPEFRPNAATCLSHPWMQGAVCALGRTLSDLLQMYSVRRVLCRGGPNASGLG